MRKRRLESIAGTVPSPLDPLSGCRFAPRCPFARADCLEAIPALREIAPGRFFPDAGFLQPRGE